MKKKRKSKFGKNFKQTLLIFAITILLFYLFTTIYSLLKHPSNIFILENGTLLLEEETEGLIIREESVVKGENYKNGMLQIKSEGEKVAKNEPIFRYYSDSEDLLKTKITETEAQIQSVMQNNEQDLSRGVGDIVLLETQIKTKLEGADKESDLQKIKENKRDINTYITKKIETIGETTKNTEIKKLIEQKTNYENELAENSEYITAPISGVVSYRVDNLEEKLTTDTFTYLNKNFINDINVKVGQVIATSEESGKIINNFKSYIAVNLNSEESKNAKIGDKVSLQLSNSESIGAEITYIKIEEDDSRTIVFEITKKIEDLVKYRRISLSIIWWKFSGFKLPNNAIISENSKFYVIRHRNGYKDKIMVKIEKQNSKYAIVNNFTEDELEKLGYTKKEINSMEKLKLYDEIILGNEK